MNKLVSAHPCNTAYASSWEKRKQKTKSSVFFGNVFFHANTTLLGGGGRKTLFEKEIEVDDSATLKNNLTFGFNASYMKSNQDLDGDKVVKETNERGFGISVDFTDTESRISGASDLLLNTDVSYFKDFKNDKSLQTTLAFNYFSDRIFALGTEGKGNLIDSSVGTLDLILKGKLSKNLGVSLTAKNILNPTIERKQETQDVIVSSYKAGANVKLSFSYNF